MQHPTTNLDRIKLIMIYLDDFTLFKIVWFRDTKSAAAVLGSIIAECVAPASLKMGFIHTDETGGFEGQILQPLDAHGTIHKFTPPDTLQFNEVVERALGLLRGMAINISMLQGMPVAASDLL